ncbi:ADP-ribosylation factor-related protein 1 [Hordeum vulgare]|nr:ADP-ribosylation factor-related protein 1 [Hordeum vulgare]
MVWWKINHKGSHDCEGGPSSGRRRSSSHRLSSPPPRPAPAAFTIAPAGALVRSRQYIQADVCRRYLETRTSLPWSDVHLPNNWHLSADHVSIPPVPVSGHAHREEINRRRCRLPDDLYYDPKYAQDFPLWDTWFRDEHDVRRA